MEKFKTVWITSTEIQRICDHVREIEHCCPYCDTGWIYPLSNGEVSDLVTSSVFIKCWKCHKSYHLAWEGDPDFMRDDEDFLPF